MSSTSIDEIPVLIALPDQCVPVRAIDVLAAAGEQDGPASRFLHLLAHSCSKEQPFFSRQQLFEPPSGFARDEYSRFAEALMGIALNDRYSVKMNTALIQAYRLLLSRGSDDLILPQPEPETAEAQGFASRLSERQMSRRKMLTGSGAAFFFAGMANLYPALELPGERPPEQRQAQVGLGGALMGTGTILMLDALRRGEATPAQVMLSQMNDWLSDDIRRYRQTQAQWQR